MNNRDIPLAGITQGQEEIDAVNRVLKSDWHVSGPECISLQKELAAYHGVKYCMVVNSGSSANLLALQCLNLPKRTRVLTSSCGFPATLNPILHLDLRPVLVDYTLCTLNVDLEQIEYTLKTIPDIKAILVAHTLGSPLDTNYLLSLARKFDVRVIEDCCEAIGAKYNEHRVGSLATVGTVSFYASHQISGFGGGGALLTNHKDIYEQAKSLRDWGKEEVREGLIYTKMSANVSGIPYDQQYTYNTIGHNMRMPDGNCAYTREQLKRLPGFVKKREENYLYLKNKLYSQTIPIIHTKILDNACPSYFGFPIVCQQEDVRDKLVEYLEDNGVHVRLFFAGNILRHPPYKNIVYDSIHNDFPVADYLMRNAFFCGCWPGLTLDDMDYIAQTIKQFFLTYK